MALFNLFGKKDRGYASPWLQLTVVYATARDGLEPDHAFALRGKVIGSSPIDFEFKDSSTFIVFFRGSTEGLQAATHLAESLREYARDKSLSAFGVGVQQGECLAQMSGTGRFAAKPAGTVIAQTMRLAVDRFLRWSSPSPSVDRFA